MSSKRNDESARSRGPAWGRLGLIVIVFFALFLAWRYTPLADVIADDRVAEWARSIGRAPWTPLLVAALYSPAAFMMFPRPLITLFSALAFGPWLGFATSMTGIAGAALSTYYAGHYLPDATVRRLAGSKLVKTAEVLRRRSFTSALAVTVAPVAPFPVIGMAAGALGISVGPFLCATLIGMTPGTAATVYFANELETVLEHPSRINYWIVAAVVTLFVGLFFVARRWLLKMQDAAGGAASSRVRAGRSL